MKILITGITGMIGAHFKKAAIEKGASVYGFSRNTSFSRLQARLSDTIFNGDILDRDTMGKILETIRPDTIVHLAAQAFNGESWQYENLTHLTNFNGTLNLLQCARKIVPDAKILLACSSAAYGSFSIDDCPLREDEQPLRPISPYGISKMAAEALGGQYYKNYQMNIYLPRLFIQLGTGHPPVTAVQNFARQLALISKGKQPGIIRCGNLETARDFLDVRDGVAALFLVLEKGKPADPINICSGRYHKMKEVLAMLVDISSLDVEVRYDNAFSRPSDEPVLVGDNSKLKALGWKQKYSLRQTLERIYQNWLDRV